MTVAFVLMLTLMNPLVPCVPEPDEERPGEKSAIARLLCIAFGLGGLVFGICDTRFQIGDFLLVLFVVELLLAAGEGQRVFVIAGNLGIPTAEILPEFELVAEGGGSEGGIRELFGLQRLALGHMLGLQPGEAGVFRPLCREFVPREKIGSHHAIVHQLHLPRVVKKHEFAAHLGLAVRCTERGTHSVKRVAEMDFNCGGQHRHGQQEKDGESFHGRMAVTWIDVQ